MVTDPRPPDSEFVTGGTSLAALSTAVNTIGPVLDGPVGLLSSLHATASAMNAASIAIRFISILLNSF